MSEAEVPSLLGPGGYTEKSVRGQPVSPPDPKYQYMYENHGLYENMSNSYPHKVSANGVDSLLGLVTGGEIDKYVPKSIVGVSSLEEAGILYNEQLEQYRVMKSYNSRTLSSLQSGLDELIEDSTKSDVENASLKLELQSVQEKAEKSTLRETTLQQQVYRQEHEQKSQKSILLDGLITDDVNIDDERMLKITEKAPHDRSLQEQVQLKLWESVYAYKGTVDSVHKHNAELQCKIEGLQSAEIKKDKKNTTLQRELTLAQKEIEINKDGYEKRLSQLNSQLSAAHVDQASITDKGRRYDDLLHRYQSLESSLQSLREESAVKDASTRDMVSKSESILQQERDMLQKLKQFELNCNHLQKECEAYQSESQRLREEMDGVRKQYYDVCIDRDKANDAMVRMQVELRVALEENITKEVARVSQRAEQDQATVKQMQQQSYERELTGLRHDKLELQHRVSMLETEVKDLRDTRDSEVRSLTSERSTIERQLGEAMVMVRSKAAEQVRVGASSDQYSAETRSLRVEQDVNSRKYMVLSEEYSKLKEELHKTTLKADTELATMKERQKSCELVERELDLALLKVGNDGLRVGSGINDIIQGIDTAEAQLGTQGSNTLKHSLLISRAQVEKQRLVEDQQSKLQANEQHVQRCELELRNIRDGLSTVKSNEDQAFIKKALHDHAMQTSDTTEKQRLLNLVLGSSTIATSNAQELVQENQNKQLLIEDLRTRCIVLEQEVDRAKKRSREQEEQLSREIRTIVQQKYTLDRLKKVFGSILKKHGRSMDKSEIQAIKEALQATEYDAQVQKPQQVQPTNSNNKEIEELLKKAISQVQMG